jgi:uncharacterized SAM-binding protein YcdF (DUF218 family)
LALPKRSLVLILIPSILLGVLLLTSGIWLTAIGRALVRDEAPRNADAIIVLAGDGTGGRVLKACQLARERLAPLILVSGPMAQYGINEADLAVHFAVQNGCSREWLRPVYFHAMSTEEEAREFGKYITGHPEIRSLLLVTSEYHTARSFRTFHKQLGSHVTLTSVAAPDRYFTPQGWWHNREGQKTVFFEVSKTLANWIGL